MEYPVDPLREVEGRGDVLLDEEEFLASVQVLEISPGPCYEVVDSDDSVPRFQEPIDEMGPQEPGGTRDENPHDGSYFPLGLTGRRPTEWYSNPSFLMVSGR